LRAETTPDAEVPVLVVDLDDGEAAKLLALLDPLAAMAERDDRLLAELLADVETENAAVQAMVAEMLAETATIEPPADEPGGDAIPAVFQVVVECRDEAEQEAVFERLTGEGYKCRAVNV
jgi:hypothetical protein